MHNIFIFVKTIIITGRPSTKIKINSLYVSEDKTAGIISLVQLIIKLCIGTDFPFKSKIVVHKPSKRDIKIDITAFKSSFLGLLLIKCKFINFLYLQRDNY